MARYTAPYGKILKAVVQVKNVGNISVNCFLMGQLVSGGTQEGNFFAVQRGADQDMLTGDPAVDGAYVQNLMAGASKQTGPQTISAGATKPFTMYSAPLISTWGELGTWFGIYDGTGKLLAEASEAGVVAVQVLQRAKPEIVSITYTVV